MSLSLLRGETSGVGLVGVSRQSAKMLAYVDLGGVKLPIPVTSDLINEASRSLG